MSIVNRQDNNVFFSDEYRQRVNDLIDTVFSSMRHDMNIHFREDDRTVTIIYEGNEMRREWFEAMINDVKLSLQQERYSTDIIDELDGLLDIYRPDYYFNE